jgi:hypothetical protein
MAEALREYARAATLAAARTFGFGGDTWSLSRPSGTGVAARSLVASSQITALAFRQRPGALGVVATATPALADIWRMIVISGAVLPGDVVTSTGSPSYTFGVSTIEPWYEYTRAELERRR